MKIMTYSKAKEECLKIIEKFEHCSEHYYDCSECPLNSTVVKVVDDEYTTLCHLMMFMKDDIKNRIEKAIG